MNSWQCEIKLFRVDGQILKLAVSASAPLRTPKRIAALFRERLASLHDDWDVGFGFDVLRLDILHADTFEESQSGFGSTGDVEAERAALIDRLGARLDTDRIRQFAFADTHIPERSFALLSVGQAGPCENIPLPDAQPEYGSTRPLLLLWQPEPVEAIAPVPDGSPIR